MSPREPGALVLVDVEERRVVRATRGPPRVVEADPLWSFRRAMRRRPADVNTPIVESYGGRLSEVTRDKRVVWEYVNPVRRTRDGADEVPTITSAVRIVEAPAPAFVAELRRSRAASR